MEEETKNAVITNARISINDRGCLDAWLQLDYGGSGQGFGGYALYLPQGWAHHADPGNYAGHFIYRVLEIAEVEQWDELRGKTLRVKATFDHIRAIGHIIKDDWFDPAADFGKIKGSAA